MATANNLSDIVDNGLCIGCGLCQSIAGKDKIEVSMSPKGRLEPKEIKKITPETFNKKQNMIWFGVIIYLFVMRGLLIIKLDLKVQQVDY